MQVLCGLQGIFLLFNCQTPGAAAEQEGLPAAIAAGLETVITAVEIIPVITAAEPAENTDSSIDGIQVLVVI